MHYLPDGDLIACSECCFESAQEHFRVDAYHSLAAFVQVLSLTMLSNLHSLTSP